MKVWRCSNAATRAVEAEVSKAVAVGKVVGVKVVRRTKVMRRRREEGGGLFYLRGIYEQQ
jgi:hypothetical protein